LLASRRIRRSSPSTAAGNNRREFNALGATLGSSLAAVFATIAALSGVSVHAELLAQLQTAQVER